MSSYETWMGLAQECERSLRSDFDVRLYVQLAKDERNIPHQDNDGSSVLRSTDRITNVIRQVLPGASLRVAYISQDHEDGDDAPVGWSAQLFLPFNQEQHEPEDGFETNKQPSASVALTKVFCLAMAAIHKPEDTQEATEETSETTEKTEDPV